MKYTTTILILCAFRLATSATAAAPVRSAGDGRSVIRLHADTVLRWSAGDTVMLDLRGQAAIYQGELHVEASRFLVWFNQSGAADGRRAELEIYAGPKSRLPAALLAETGEPPLMLRLTTTGGTVIDGGELIASERPIEDEFLIRAAVAHGDLPPEAADPAAIGALGLIRPSAERIVISDMNDQGATVTLSGNARIVVGADDSSANALLSQGVEIAADVIRVRFLFREETAPPGAPSPAASPGNGGATSLQSIYAEGAVDLQSDSDRVTAEALYLDWPLQEGLALDARVRTQGVGGSLPLQFHADAVREMNLYRFKVEGAGYFSTSMFWFPHYRVEARDIEFVRGPPASGRSTAKLDPVEDTAKFYQKAPPKPTLSRESVVVSARHNTVRLESVPILYWPYVAKDVRTGAFLLEAADFGTSGTLGTFLQLRWNLYDLGLYHNDWSTLSLRTDFFSERGVGTGLDFAYRGEDRVGFLRGYYINDSAREDDEGVPLTQHERGELTLRHREFLSDEWTADFELGYLSDRRFLRTYDRRSFDSDKDRETMIQLSRISDNTLLQARASARLNDFQTQVERQGAAYHIVGEPLGEGPLIWTSHTDVAHLRLRYDELLKTMPSPDDVSRFDTAHEISWPLQAGFVRLDPYLWGDATFFSEDADGDGNTVRGAAAYGVRAGTNFHRTFDVQSPLLQIERLRHTITPTVTYENVFAVSDEPSDFIQHDEIDARDELHRIRLGLRNRLETHRLVNGRRRRVELALLDADYVANFKSPETPFNTDDFVEATAWWHVSEEVSLGSADNRYNVEKGRFEAANGELKLDFWRPLSVSLIYKYYLDLNVAGEPAHSVSLARVAWQPPYSRWKVEFATAYDFNAKSTPGGASSRGTLGSSIFLTRRMEDWDFTFGAEFNQGRENETLLTFNVTPPGVRSRFTPSRSPI
jgi:hypothetical protein